MPEPTSEEAQRSRLRVNQVWACKVDDTYVSVVGLEQDWKQRRVRVLPCSKPQGSPTEFLGAEQAVDYDQFFELYRLYWEAGNKELGAATDLTGKLKQLRAAKQPVDLIGDRRREYEAQHASDAARIDLWWLRLDPKVQQAAQILHHRRHELVDLIGGLQAELDGIDAALTSLTETETPRAGE